MGKEKEERVEKSRPRQQGPDFSELCLPTFNSPEPTDSLTGAKMERVDLNGRGSFQETNLNAMVEARSSGALFVQGFRKSPTGPHPYLQCWGQGPARRKIMQGSSLTGPQPRMTAARSRFV